jgi:predicted nucleic acid-binding protein
MGHLLNPGPLPVAGGLLAATARARGLILVTRNVLNPFGPSGRSK